MKRHFEILGTITCILVLIGCASSDKYTSLASHPAKAEDCNIDVYMPNDVVKKDFVNIGLFTVEDTGLSLNCDLENSIIKNKKAACLAGADAVKFTSIQPPDFKSTCFRTISSFIKYK
jgi:hypothetical protein